jgi:sugar lactone lactonase YvrE
VAEIDLETGEVLNRMPLPGPGNDITIDAESRLYVSNPQGAAVYKTIEGKFEEWFKGDISGVNGLLVHKNELIIGVSSNHTLAGIDLKTKKIRTIAKFRDGVMDGIEVDENGDFLVSTFPDKIYRVTSSGEKTLLLYNPNTQFANFCYIPDKRLFIIPNLAYNTITAYSYGN